jgi:uncharacterized protein YecT (DUF1311 family)
MKKLLSAALIATAIALQPAAHAQKARLAPYEQPCTETENNGKTDCFIYQYNKAEETLNKIYPLAIAAMKEQDRNQAEQLRGYEEALRKSQRAWIAYRDAQCDLASFNARGGSEASLEGSACATTLTKERTAFLRDYALKKLPF